MSICDAGDADLSVGLYRMGCGRATVVVGDCEEDGSCVEENVIAVAISVDSSVAERWPAVVRICNASLGSIRGNSSSAFARDEYVDKASVYSHSELIL